MKKQSIHAALAVLACLAGGVVACAGQTARAATLSLHGTSLEVRTDRPSYTLGEVVTLDITARNSSPMPIALPGSFDVWTGHVGVLIAFEDGPFREYRGPGWGLHDVSGVEAISLRTRQSLETEASILYNHGMARRHVNSRAAARITTRYMDEGYALPIPGRYRIKTVLHGVGFLETIESVPVEISVRDAEGADRAVWQVLGTEPDFGYFIQAGRPRARWSAARTQHLLAVLERLATEYPGSRHAERMREGLTKYRELLDEQTARGVAVR